MGVLRPLLYPGYKEWDRGLEGHLLIGWGRVGRRVRQIPPPYGVGGETGYTVPLIVTTWGRDGREGSGFSVSASQDPPWFNLLFCPWVTTFLSLSLSLFIFRPNSLAPFDTLLISNYLLISLLRHLGTQSQRKRGDDHSGFFRLYWGIVGLWVPFACSLSGCIYRGRWESMEW